MAGGRRNFNRQAHDYQVAAVQFLVERQHAGLLAKPGRGKTIVFGMATKIMQEVGYVERTLVIAPLRPCTQVWPYEFQEWDETAHFSVGVLHGAKKERVLWEEDHDFYVVNPEGIPWLVGEIAKMKRFPFQQLGVDEASMYKDTSTQRFKLLKSFLPLFKYRRIMTGSPRPNSLLDLYGPMYVMDLGKTFGPYFTHYRNKYFFKCEQNWFEKQDAETNIYSVLAPKVMVVGNKTPYHLPELTINPIKIELPKKARAVYDQLEQQFMVRFSAKKKVTAVNAAVMSMKCRQVASGTVYLDDDQYTRSKRRDIEVIHHEKDEALLEIIESLGGKPVMVVYAFQHERDHLLSVFGEDTPYLGGGVSPKKAKEIEDRWNEGKIPVLLVHPKSMSHGLNLQKTEADIIWRSLTWSFEQYDQLIQRIWRQGQKFPVTVHVIMARDTLDEAVWDTLKRKAKGEEGLMAAVGAYWEHRQKQFKKAA